MEGGANEEREDTAPGAPSLSLPKGGGALRPIDEKFTVNPSTGTAGAAIPIFTTTGRGGLNAALGVKYDSGGGNGPFGVGWSLDVPAIARKTDKGLPCYQDDDDVYVLSGAEDLVPVSESPRGTFLVRRFQPRVEQEFARIERWLDRATGDVHWRAITRRNRTSIYGDDASSRIADPARPDRIFRWLLARTFDEKGELIRYVYKKEDLAGVDRSRSEEAGRGAPSQRYLKRVQYGFAQPYVEGAEGGPGAAAFEVVLDYGDHDPETPTVDESQPWPVRLDPFSNYRSTFEVRSYRLCRRVLMFHRLAELGETPQLVRSTDFTYREAPALTLLASAKQVGYLRNTTDGSYSVVAPDGTRLSPLALPSLDFDYSEAQLDTQVHAVAAEPAGGVEGRNNQWLDLDGEGVAGVLTASRGGWFYRRSRGARAPGGVDVQHPLALWPAEAVASQPSAAGTPRFLDLEGDGRAHLALFGPGAGYFARTDDGEFAPFAPFRSAPRLDVDHPDARFVDLDGDGLADLLFTTDGRFLWHRSLGSGGFDAARELPFAADEEHGPRLLLSDGTRTIFLADMTGDGLSDLVRVRPGEVSYWPNLGYGRFGARVTMSGVPAFAEPEQFDPARVRLADVDGSGTSDLIYLGRDGVRVWLNRAGNSLAPPLTLPAAPPAEALASVDVRDLLGTGTACLVWSSPWPGDAAAPLRYVDLMGSRKPHLLTSVKNNYGAETRVEYASSTQFYLADRDAGRPWQTRLAFPVQVVARVEHLDAIAGTSLVQTYRYRHGWFDPVEREFRGFAMVETRDAETVSSGTLALPPVVTRRWFHTGLFVDEDSVSRHLAEEYWQGDPTPQLADSILPAAIDTEDERQARRALKGKLLREELYAEDGVSDARYRVRESAYTVERLAPRGDGPYSVFFTVERESLELIYERQAADPRTQHRLTLAFDDHGNVTRAATVAYPRRAPVEPEQARSWVTLHEQDVINVDGQPDWYRAGVASESRDWELTGAAPKGALFTTDELNTRFASATEIAFELEPDGSLQKRLFGRRRHFYLSEDLASTLPLGQVASHGLLAERRHLALTPGLVTGALAGVVTPSVLTSEGAYADDGGAFWARSGHAEFGPSPGVADPTFARAHFFLPQRYVDPFARAYEIGYDPHLLLAVGVSDPVGNTRSAQVNYRVLQPWLLTDPNGDRDGVRFDALGRVVALARIGQLGGSDGDVLDVTTSEAAPGDDPSSKLEYVLDQFTSLGRPNYVHTLARERYRDPTTPWQESYTFSDGSNRIVLSKRQAPEGDAPARDATGNLVHDPSGKLVFADTADRWIGSGRVVYDNKGNAVKRYEPFFDTTWRFEDEVELVQWGVTSIVHYDPLGRAARVDKPDGTLTRVEFDAWERRDFDENDTLLESAWHTAHAALPAGVPGREADDATLPHANTPSVTRLDGLGRAFLSIADNGGGVTFATRTKLDVQGRARLVTDALGRAAATQDFDLLGRVLRAQPLDATAPERSVTDGAGLPIRRVSSRGSTVRSAYDDLRRLVRVYVDEGAGEKLREVRVWGEAVQGAASLHLRSRAYQIYDGAGLATTDGYDFKGNLARSSRLLAQRFDVTLDYTALDGLTDPAALFAAAQPQLQPPASALVSLVGYDALDRQTSTTAPDGSVTQPSYDRANQLASLAVTAGGNALSVIKSIAYNARGQRTQVDWGNGALSTYDYDPETFRVARLQTVRVADRTALQDLSYTYDPVGNVIVVTDGAQQTLFFAGAAVSPDLHHRYDALYRLLHAEGREHAGAGAELQPDDNDLPIQALPHPNDANAVRRYVEDYVYDGVGNLQSVKHSAPQQIWWRQYQYLPANAPADNLLRATSVATDPTGGPYSAKYSYDAHGNVTSMPHLTSLAWDFAERLTQTAVARGGACYYAYDSTGRRVRQVISDGGVVYEHVYLGGWERYTRTNSGVVAIARNRLRVETPERLVVIDRDEGQAPVVRYQLSNRIGSALVELDDAANVISYEEFHPYGTSAYRAGRAAAETSLKRYRYVGKERDERTGFYYYGARYYAPWLGRFISPDPAGFVDGTNRYAYARNNPTTLTDALGRQAVEPDKNKKPQKADKADDPATYGLKDPGPGRWTLVLGGTQQQMPDSAPHDQREDQKAEQEKRNAELAAPVQPQLFGATVPPDDRANRFTLESNYFASAATSSRATGSGTTLYLRGSGEHGSAGFLATAQNGGGDLSYAMGPVLRLWGDKDSVPDKDLHMNHPDLKVGGQVSGLLGISRYGGVTAPLAGAAATLSISPNTGEKSEIDVSATGGVGSRAQLNDSQTTLGSNAYGTAAISATAKPWGANGVQFLVLDLSLTHTGGARSVRGPMQGQEVNEDKVTVGTGVSVPLGGGMLGTIYVGDTFSSQQSKQLPQAPAVQSNTLSGVIGLYF